MLERFFEILRRFVKAQSVKVCFDIGSRDCIQSRELLSNFKESTVYAFECNTQTLSKCYDIASKSNNKIIVVPKAVNEFNGMTKFYQIDPTTTVTSWQDSNPGASSLFVANGLYEYEKYGQKEITVSCTRLDTFCKSEKVEKIDIIHLDCQGAELIALKSLSNLIHNVISIHTEVSFKTIYHGQCMFDDIDQFLTIRGFKLINELNRSGWQDDAVYINMKYIDQQTLLSGILSNNSLSDKTVLESKFKKMDVQTVSSTSLMDVLMLVAPVDLEIAKIAIDFLFENVDFQNLYIISTPNINLQLNQHVSFQGGNLQLNLHIQSNTQSVKLKPSHLKHDIKYLDQDTLLLPFNFIDIHNATNSTNRARWIWQQLVKLHCDLLCVNENVLIVDADTVFLQKTHFFDKDVPLYATSDEYHEPYFIHMKKLLGLDKQIAKSGVVHHMLFEKRNLEFFRENVKKYQNSKQEFWKLFICCLDPHHLDHSACSEYEMYINFIIKLNRPHKIRNLKYINCSFKFFQQNLEKLKTIQSFVSCHNYLN